MKLFNRLTKFTALCILTPLIYIPAVDAAVSFNKYRVVLSKTKTNDTLVLINGGNQASKCNLGLNHYQVAKNSLLTQQSDLSKVFNPASRLLRYSPRSVNIPANSSQSVKVMARRKANLETGEYMSYLKISCKDEVEAVLGKPTVGAVVNYNIPIHYRVGTVVADTKLEISSVKKLTSNRYLVNVRQYRTGNRSVIGNLELIDVDTDEVLDVRANIGLYQAADYIDHSFTIDEVPKAGLTLSFKENKSYQGNLVQTLHVDKKYF